MPATHNWGSYPHTCSSELTGFQPGTPLCSNYFLFEARLLLSRRKQPQEILNHTKQFIWRQFMSLTPKANDNQRFSPAVGPAVSQSCPGQSTPCHPAATPAVQLLHRAAPSPPCTAPAHHTGPQPTGSCLSSPFLRLSSAATPHTHPEIKPKIKSCGSQPY